MTEPKWKLKVEQLMACNCNWGCPCSFDAPPTYGKCETALAYRIAKGSYGGVALDGLKFILVAAWPKAIHLGQDRKSTRLNSSHQMISYAVFCLKKKKDSVVINKRDLIW